MGGPAAGDDVITAIAVEVGGQGILAGHAAVVDGDAIEYGRIRSRPGIKDKNAWPSGTRCCRTVRVTLADDQFVILVFIKVGAPDGMTPLEGFGNDPPSCFSSFKKDAGAWIRRRVLGVNHNLVSMPWLNRGDVTKARFEPADLHFTGSLVRRRLLIAGAKLRLYPLAGFTTIEQEHTLPAGQHDLVAAVSININKLQVVDRM